jgi:hypothetical protein
LPTLSNWIRWSGVAALLSGALLVLKGVVIILYEADPSFVPPATFLCALGMVGLLARLEGHGGPLAGSVSSWPGRPSPRLSWT